MADKNFKVKTGLTLPSPLPVDQGGTGQTSTTNTLNSLLPSQAGNANKVLSTDGTNTSFITLPVAYTRGTTSQRPVSPTAGDLFFNTEKKAFEVWTGSAWVSVAVNGAVPLPPTIGTVTLSGLTASVPFTGPNDFGDAAITTYTATSNPDSISVSSASSPISITGLTAGTAYTFTVTATNTFGISNASSASNSVTTANVPGAPTSVTAADTGIDGEALIAWTAPGSNGGSAITDYVIEYSSNGGSSYSTFADGTSTGTSATVISLTIGTTYIFRVKSVNAIGTGTASTDTSSYIPIEHDASAYFPIATYTSPSGGSSTITFASIPQTYKHLQIRATLRNTGASAYAFINLGAGTYKQHIWYANGTAFIVGAYGGNDILHSNISTAPSQYFSPSIIDIPDYTSTNKAKVIRAVSGAETTSSTGSIMYGSAMVTDNTNAVSTITLTASAGNFATYSQATLYGIKG